MKRRITATGPSYLERLAKRWPRLLLEALDHVERQNHITTRRMTRV